MSTATHFFDLTPDSLEALVLQWGWPKFRAKQLLEWVYTKKIADPQAMSNFSKLDREKLAQNLRFLSGEILQHQKATDGVQKLLIGWEPIAGIDEEKNSQKSPEIPVENALKVVTASSQWPQTECVMIPADDDSVRQTACISSQVGCPVGCHFCASGIGGLEANLSAGRIIEQVWRLSTLENVDRISNVVFMGMGEPLSNFENVIKAVRTLMAGWGMGISARKITISTVGVPAPIRRLADMEIPVTLALSLHAPNDALRRKLIPWANYVTIDQLLSACRYYFDKTGREITIEYILLRNVNDQPQHAKELATITRSLRANVNLIRYNEVKGIPYNRPDTEDVRQFQNILKQAGVNTHIRASRGRDIAAACGQLRHEHQP